jgi:hypothetical protein
MRVRVLNGTSGIGETGLRTRWLEAQGYKVIRFGNDDVIENIEGVGLRIIEEAQKRKSSLLHPQLASPLKGEEPFDETPMLK